MLIDSCEQRSDEWHIKKAGVPSSSNFDKIITTTGKLSKQADAYMLRLAGERYIGKAQETYQSWSMQRGTEMEDEARSYYEMITGETVHQVGMIFHNEARKTLCSPDGIILEGEEGSIFKKGLEIKCPEIHTHIQYLLDDRLPPKYFNQVQGSMFITGVEEWDFLSYYPGLPPFLITVQRDEKFIRALETALLEFCVKLEEVFMELKEKAT